MILGSFSLGFEVAFQIIEEFAKCEFDDPLGSHTKRLEKIKQIAKQIISFTQSCLGKGQLRFIRLKILGEYFFD